MAITLFALALLAADPAPAAPPPADAAVATQAKEDPDYMPAGAPRDDFAFVAWCDGVLSGHMDLATRISDVLPLDDEQQTIGHAYLRAYAKAMAVAPESKTEAGRKRAADARQTGWNNWDAARNAKDKNLAIDTYLAYQLPGRCEHAAERLAHDPHLFRMAPSVDEVSAMSTNPVGAQADHMDTTRDAPPRAPAAAEVAHVQPAAMPEAAPPAKAPPPAYVAMAPAPAPAPAAMAPSGPAVSAVSHTADDEPAPVAAPVKVADAPAPAAPAPAAVVKTAEASAPAKRPWWKLGGGAKKPADAQPAKTAAAADDDHRGDIVHMPKKGHLLPPFLRFGKDKDDDGKTN